MCPLSLHSASCAHPGHFISQASPSSSYQESQIVIQEPGGKETQTNHLMMILLSPEKYVYDLEENAVKWEYP